MAIGITALCATACGGTPEEVALDGLGALSEGEPPRFVKNEGIQPKEIVPDSDVGDEDMDQEVPKGFLQKSEQSAAEIFSWTKNDNNQVTSPDVYMKPINTHICFLTRVSGNFGGNSGVYVHRSTDDVATICPWGPFLGLNAFSNDSGATWKLAGCQHATNSLTAEATCVPGSSFILDPDGIVTGSPVQVAKVLPTGTTCNASQSKDLWTFTAVSYINSIMGYMNGGGEKAEILSFSDRSSLSKVRVQSQYCGSGAQVQAAAYSLFAGPSSLVQDTRRIGVWALDASNGSNRTAQMIKTTDGVCYLTKISGSLDGAGEKLRIYPKKDAAGVEYWMFEARSQYGGSAYGAAQCILYDQRYRNPD
jgi:hypothetical protein